jgi:hypothetical protein
MRGPDLLGQVRFHLERAEKNKEGLVEKPNGGNYS